MSEFKKCKEGHYYQGDKCPYCSTPSKENANTVVHNSELKTQVVKNNDKTVVIDSNASSDKQPGASVGVPGQNNNQTVFGDDVIIGKPTGEIVIEKEFRNSRMLVGWLVTYSHDKMGIDYRLYEGRNIIGRTNDCNIVVNDKMISGKHAVLLFKNGVYKIKDELSTHGTIVNDVDIEDEHCTLKDGDTIVLGQTVFKFKISL